MMQYLPPPNADKVLAVGFGTAGCRILSHLEQTNMSIDSYAYISCEKKDMPHSSSAGSSLFMDIGFREGSSLGHVRGVAQKHMKEIRRILSGSHLVFLVAGLGGCTGSGLIPLVAQVAREEGIMTVSVITMPFGFEKSRHFYAGISLRNVRQNSDAVIIIDNDTISSDKRQMPIPRFYSLINERISVALSKIAESSGELNVGLNRLVDTITNNGYTVLGLGTSSSINKAEEATVKAAESVYGIVEPEEASGAILYLMGNKSLTANELATSTSRLNTMLGRGALEVHQGFSASGGETTVAILLASGFKTTKFDDYDPLDKVLQNRQIDSEMDYGIDAEDLSNLVQIE